MQPRPKIVSMDVLLSWYSHFIFVEVEKCLLVNRPSILENMTYLPAYILYFLFLQSKPPRNVLLLAEAGVLYVRLLK